MADGGLYESSSKLPQYIAALAASFGALATGTIVGWTAPVEVSLIHRQEYGFPISAEQFSWIGAMVNLGAALMCLLIGILMKMIGRKWAILALVLPMLIGWLLVIFANGVPMLMVGRVLLGAGGGTIFTAVPTYTAEIAQPSIRGTLANLSDLFLTVGILFVYWVGAAVNVLVLNIICSVIPILFGLMFLFMPESPYYYIENNRDEDASKALQWLRGSKYDERMEVEELKAEHARERAEKITLWQSCQQRATIRAFIISLGLMFFQQLSGINAVLFYATTIFDDANTGLDADTATIIFGVIQMVATLVAAIIVDKVGRRILLMISGFFMAVSMIVLAVYFQLKEAHAGLVENLGWLPVLTLCIYVAMFSFGLGPIPWLMAGELFASNVKAYGSPLAGVFSWLLSFLVTKIFTNLRDAFGIAGDFWLFAGMSLLGTVFVFFLVPETKGITLADIQRVLSGGSIQPVHGEANKRESPKTGQDKREL